MTETHTLTFEQEMIQMEVECKKLEKEYESKKETAKGAKDAFENKKDDIRKRIREQAEPGLFTNEGETKDKQPG